MFYLKKKDVGKNKMLRKIASSILHIILNFDKQQEENCGYFWKIHTRVLISFSMISSFYWKLYTNYLLYYSDEIIFVLHFEIYGHHFAV